MLPDVLRLEPVLVARPWGGGRLATLGREVPPDTTVGESWEVVDLPDGVAAGVDDPRSRVAAGPLAGASPADLIGRFGGLFLGSAHAAPGGRFPLLVKLLDAGENLSVQVHPHEAYVAAHPEVRAKTESWYVMEADPESSIWFDVRADVDDRSLASALGKPGLVALLGRLPARAGDFHHVPAGRVHALGAGVMVLEVQTPSDTTFRLYDWAAEYDRAPRPLHPDEALATIVRGDPEARSVARDAAPGSRDLVHTGRYWMREHRANGHAPVLDPRPELRIVTVVEGEAVVGDQRLAEGDVAVLPAVSDALGPVDTSPGAVLVETGLV